MEWKLASPVAFFIFNRPDHTRAVFARIAQARPARLFLVADGPRAGAPRDRELCEAARRVVLDHIDWACDVSCDLSDHNLGCRRRVSSGLDWVFSQADQAIVFEDDCVPDPTLFRFCDDMLRHYCDDERVMAISGFNIRRDGWKTDSQDYHFTVHPSLWGWATWRRAWQHYDVDMRLLTDPATRQRVREFFADPLLGDQWLERLDMVARGDIDTWDYQWIFACAVRCGLTLVPARNLVKNIGFGENATHTTRADDSMASIPVTPARFPLRWQEHVGADYDYIWRDEASAAAGGHRDPAVRDDRRDRASGA